jgi:hypothetical protein
MEKIIAREIAPENVDFSFYFDHDGFKEAGGENCAVYILGPYKGGFNLDEYREIQNEAEEADYDDDIYGVANYLTHKTGKRWAVQSFRGYSQGDYCQVLYCPERYPDDFVEEIGKMWLGCGTEFCIDGVRGCFVVDIIRWAEDERLVNLLADYAGCDPTDLEVHLYVGSHKVNDYKILSIGNKEEDSPCTM